MKTTPFVSQGAKKRGTLLTTRPSKFQHWTTDVEHRFVKIGTDGSRLDAGAKEWAAVFDAKTGLTWALETTKVDNWNKADAAAKAVRACGFGDWRLPTVDELFALADRTRFSPAIDTEYFPGTAGDWFWADTPWGHKSEDYAWYVNFERGNADCYEHGYWGYVRAVRSGVS